MTSGIAGKEEEPFRDGAKRHGRDPADQKEAREYKQKFQFFQPLHCRNGMEINKIEFRNKPLTVPLEAPIIRFVLKNY